MELQASTEISVRDLQIDLCAAILLVSIADAISVLDTADRLDVDPLDYCMHRFGLGEAVVLWRAAQWAGLRFAPEVPHTIRGSAIIRRLDSLAGTRALHARLDERDVTFLRPRFAELVTLRRRIELRPAIAADICIVPGNAIRTELAEATSNALVAEARQRLARRWPYASAHLDLPLHVRIGFVVLLAAAIAIAALAPLIFRPLLVPLVGIVLLAPAMLRFAACFARLPPDPADPPVADAVLPVYSVLVPLRDEAHMVPLLQRALGALDYPPEKLDIVFIVEAQSADTVAAVQLVLADPRFQLVVVPDALPHTKPKALDYALPLVRGAHVVVYDAEDIPDRDQLRRAANRFAADPGLDCVQAELVIDNGAENWLTALFAAEYAGQFGLLLPLLAHWKLPMPLGGTSNHFRTASLREVGGWDAFNVTEDADLGVRLSRLRYRSATLRSQTAEEAPIHLGAWMRQRTRWMKGWMQTFIVHNRSPRRFLRDIGWRGFLGFEIYVGGLILSSLLHSVFLVSLAAQLMLSGNRFSFADPWDIAYLVTLVAGYGAAFILAAAGLIRQRQSELLAYQALLPAYWVLHSIAAVRAAIELLTRPYFWGKTSHGHTKMQRQTR